MTKSRRSPAENFLVNEGVFTRHSDSLAQLLECMRCQLTRYEPELPETAVSSRQLERCTGLSKEAVGKNMDKIEQAELVHSWYTSMEGVRGRTHQFFYAFEKSDRALQFALTLRLPERCYSMPQNNDFAESPDDRPTARTYIEQATQLRQGTMDVGRMAARLGMTTQNVRAIEKSGDVSLQTYLGYLNALGCELIIWPKQTEQGQA